MTSMLEKYRHHRRQNIMAAKLIIAAGLQGLMGEWAALILKRHTEGES